MNLRKFGGLWGIAALIVVLAGVGGSLVVARTFAAEDAKQSRQAFATSAGDIAATVELAFQHEHDLLLGGLAYLVGNPAAPKADFARWAVSVRAFERYPELARLGIWKIVPAAEVPAFSARVAADPSHHLAQDGKLAVAPFAGRVCLSSVSVSRGSDQAPEGLNFCALHATEQINRDAGVPSYGRIAGEKVAWLGLGAPVYRGGVIPRTVAARRREFIGWVGMNLRPDVVIGHALAAHPGIAVALSYRGNASAVRFAGGTAPAQSTTVSSNVLGGWKVTASGAVAGAGLFAHADAALTLLGGLAVSSLIGLLLLVLGTGRMRALRLVAERTRSLSASLTELESSQEERARLLDHTVEIADRERVEIAADLHDGPVQQLTAVALSLDLLSASLSRGERERAASTAENIRRELANEMGALRRLMTALRPRIIEERGLEAALRDAAGEILDGTSTTFELDSRTGDADLAPEQETAVYRVVREALNNVRRHAAASSVRVALESTGQSFRLTIEDDGHGFDAADVRQHGFGLTGMRERIQALGGNWSLETARGEGTRIVAAFTVGA